MQNRKDLTLSSNVYDYCQNSFYFYDTFHKMLILLSFMKNGKLSSWTTAIEKRLTLGILFDWEFPLKKPVINFLAER